MSAADMVYAAQSQVGYLEKASNYDLNSFTGNPGNGNWTKYGAWYGLNPAEWCDMFVSWCANTAGESAAVGKYAYCPYHVNYFKGLGRWYNRGITPHPGDVIFFGDADHVGIVETSDAYYVHTIEGNTKGSLGVGCVMRHTYSVNDPYIMGYGRPAYNGGDKPTKELKVFAPWKEYKNGSTDETVYKDTDFTTPTGSFNPYESAWCTGKYGDAWCILYKLDGTEDDWAVGYVKYDGGLA